MIGAAKMAFKEPVIPDIAAALFWLDGTVEEDGGSYYFTDRTGNDRRFLITGKDFDSARVRGFPYKSAAYISAPAADATLIAADVDNFLYDAGGTPNTIPVISFFQDIDYAHKLFSRHIARVVDAEGAETYEPRVVDIVLYQPARAGSDLAACQTYYGVPTKDVAYNWTTKAGSDAPGRGSEALPWLTTQYAENNCAVGANIYVGTGQYSEFDAGFNYVMYNKKVRMHALGLTQLINSGSSVAYLLRMYTQGDTSVERMRFLSPVTTYTGALVGMEGPGDAIEKCELNGLCSSSMIYVNIAGDFSVRNSIITQPTGSTLLYLYLNGTTLNWEGNICNIVNGSYALNNATNTVTANIKNNKFLGKWSTACLRMSAPGAKNIVGNTFMQANAANGRILNVDASVAQDLLFRSNRIVVTVAPTATDLVVTQSILTSIIIDKNVIDVGAVTVATFKPIYIANNASCQITNNVITSLLDGTIKPIQLTSTGTDIDGGVVQGNVIQIASGTVGYGIMVGEDATGASDGKCDNCVVKQNALYGQNYGAAPVLLSTHGIEYGFSKGLMTQNHIIGSGIGCISKWENADGSDITYNVIQDTTWSLYSKGSNGTKMYNNFVRNTVLPKFYGVYVIVNIAVAPTNIEVKNNIIINDVDNANCFLMLFPVASIATLQSDYNVFYTARADGKIVFLSDGSTYTLAEWQALGYDTHSVLLTPAQLAAQFPAGRFYPTTPIAGADLGATYQEGLAVTTNWGVPGTRPVVAVQNQSATWQAGAYVQ